MDAETKTAVQCFIDSYWQVISTEHANKLLELEKQQIINAWDDGCNKGYYGDNGNAEGYYCETFKKQNLQQIAKKRDKAVIKGNNGCAVCAIDGIEFCELHKTNK